MNDLIFIFVWRCIAVINDSDPEKKVLHYASFVIALLLRFDKFAFISRQVED